MPSPLSTLGCALLALAAAGTALAQQQVYRYTDATGRVIYSDRPPPADARNIQPKRLGANYIETTAMPLVTQEAMDRFPVTLYSFDCGEVCQSAEALLNRRGVPFTQVDVATPDGSAKLKSVTGDQAAPVLQVGDKLIAKGYSETKWQSLLDEAGYPKTPANARPRTANRPAAETAKPETAPPATATPPARGTDYPK